MNKISYVRTQKIAHIPSDEGNIRGLLETQNGDVIAYYCVEVEDLVIGELVDRSILVIPRDGSACEEICGVNDIWTLIQLESGDFVCGQLKGPTLFSFCLPIENISLSYPSLEKGFMKLINTGQNSFVCLTQTFDLFSGIVDNGNVQITKRISSEKMEHMEFNHGKLITASFEGIICLRDLNLEVIWKLEIPHLVIGSIEYLYTGIVAVGTNNGRVILINSPPNRRVFKKTLKIGRIERHRWVFEVKELRNRLLVSGAVDGIVRIWDGNRNYNLLHALNLNSVRSILELKDNTVVISTRESVQFFEFRCNWTSEYHSYFPEKFKETVKNFLLLPLNVPIEMKFEIIHELSLLHS